MTQQMTEIIKPPDPDEESFQGKCSILSTNITTQWNRCNPPSNRVPFCTSNGPPEHSTMYFSRALQFQIRQTERMQGQKRAQWEFRNHTPPKIIIHGELTHFLQHFKDMAMEHMTHYYINIIFKWIANRDQREIQHESHSRHQQLF
jgi:hypothetical protein